MIELSIIIPAFNEARDIEANVRQLSQKLDTLKLAYEIILVNDGSTDKTLDTMHRMKNAHLTILTYDHNKGKGHAVHLGMEKAQGQYHLFMDADLSTSLDALEIFLNHMRRNDYDMIIGDRQSNRQQQRLAQPFHRRILGKIFIVLSCICVGKIITDFNCGFKIFSKETSKLLFSQQRIYNWAFDTEIIYIAILNKKRIGQIPVVWNHHPSSTVKPWRDVFTSLYDLVRIKCNGLTCMYTRR